MAWLTGWQYRKNHIITAAAGAGTGYQKRVIVHYGAGVDSGEDVYLNSKCKTDFGDIRFTDDDGSTELDYWMEQKVDSNYAIFWVKVNDDLSTNAQTIYIYYGNAGASTTSNGTNTFPVFFEDFEGQALGAVPSGWTGHTSYFRIGSVAWNGTRGVEGRDQTAGAYWLYKNFTNQTGTFAIEIFLRVEIANIAGGFELLDGATNVTWVALREALPNNISYYDTNYHDFMPWTPATWYRIKLLVNIATDTYDIYVDDVLKVSNVAFRALVSQLNKISIFTYKNPNYNRYYDTIFIHKWQPTEPTHGAWGSEEDATPADPTNIAAVCQAGPQIRVTWTDNATSETAYYIERQDADGAWTQLNGALPPNTQLYDDSTIVCDVQCKYRVRAYNSNSGIYSNYATLSSAIICPCPVIPSAPKGIVKKPKRWVYDYDWKHVPSEHIQANIIYSFEQTKKIVANILHRFMETIGVISEPIAKERFSETIPVESSIIVKFLETVPLVGHFVKKFEETIALTGDTALKFSESTSIKAEDVTTKEHILKKIEEIDFLEDEDED